MSDYNAKMFELGQTLRAASAPGWHLEYRVAPEADWSEPSFEKGQQFIGEGEYRAVKDEPKRRQVRDMNDLCCLIDGGRKIAVATDGRVYERRRYPDRISFGALRNWIDEGILYVEEEWEL